MLFLCTGNYYRSRFAELLFNHLASQDGLDWVAISRALALETGSGNIGPISRAAVAGLVERGIRLDQEFRYPIGLDENDLAGANHVVALKREEHLPLLRRKFPRWVKRVEFWRVHDMDLATAHEGMAEIDQNVRGLMQRLRTLNTSTERLP